MRPLVPALTLYPSTKLPPCSRFASRSIADPDAPNFDRASFVTMGLSSRARVLVVEHVDDGQTFRIISARRAVQKKDSRSQSRPEYDFRNGVRGKYASRYWEVAASGGLVGRRSRVSEVGGRSSANPGDRTAPPLW